MEFKRLRVAGLRRDACVFPPKVCKVLLESLQVQAYPQPSSSVLLEWLRKVAGYRHLFADCVFSRKRSGEAVYYLFVLAATCGALCFVEDVGCLRMWMSLLTAFFSSFIFLMATMGF